MKANGCFSSVTKIAFDYAGTLVQPARSMTAADLLNACEKCEIDVPEGFESHLSDVMAEQARAYRSGCGVDRSFYEQVLAAMRNAGIEPPSAQKLTSALAVADRARGQDVTKPGTHAALTTLSRAGYGMVLASNSRLPAASRQAALERLGLAEFFEDVIVSSALGHSKPSTAFFDALYRDTEREHILFVGDSFRRDVLGAMRAGLCALWVAPASFAGTPRLRKRLGVTDSVARMPELLGVQTR